MKFATAILIFSATGHASAGGPVSDPAPAAPAAAAAAPDATEKHPRDPGSNLRRRANGASTGVDVAAAQLDHRRRLQPVGSEASVYVATAVSVATCTGVGQNLATIEECNAAVSSLGLDVPGYHSSGDWSNAPPGCICEPGSYCWFNSFVGGPAREDRFLVCKDTQASFYADMLALQQASNTQQASYNAHQVAHQEASNALQAAGLGPEFKTNDGHLVYPYAAILDPTGTSRRTAFDFVGEGWPEDANDNWYYYFHPPGSVLSDVECGESCLATSAVVHGLVGYATLHSETTGAPSVEPVVETCYCLCDTVVAYTHVLFENSSHPLARGTGRITGSIGNGYQLYERVYVL